MTSKVEPAVASIIDKVKRDKLIEAEQAFMAALKAGRFEDALSQSQVVLALDPNSRVKEFLSILEEKVELDAPTDEDEEGDEEESDEEGDEGGDDNDDDGDDDEEEEEESSEDEDEDEDMDDEEGISEQVEKLAEQLADEISLNPANMGSAIDRKKLQIVLAKSMIGIMEKETQKQVINDDPLLGA